MEIVSHEFTYSGHDFKITGYNEDHIFKFIKSRNTFYEIDLLEEICFFPLKEGIIIDVGANIGNHSVYLSKILNKEVHAFEPLSTNFDLLQTNIQNNNLGSHIFPHQLAVHSCNHSGYIKGHSDTNMGMGRFIVQDSGTSQNKNAIKSIALDDQFAARAVSLIKIDVEGDELNVLSGASNIVKFYKPIIIAEADTIVKKNSLIQYLSEFGYHLVSIKANTDTLIFSSEKNTSHELGIARYTQHCIQKKTSATNLLSQNLVESTKQLIKKLHDNSEDDRKRLVDLDKTINSKLNKLDEIILKQERDKLDNLKGQFTDYLQEVNEIFQKNNEKLEYYRKRSSLVEKRLKHLVDNRNVKNDKKKFFKNAGLEKWSDYEKRLGKKLKLPSHLESDLMLPIPPISLRNNRSEPIIEKSNINSLRFISKLPDEIQKLWMNNKPSADSVLRTHEIVSKIPFPLLDPCHKRVCSVIVTAYNKGKFIKDAILSLLSQTERNIEIVVINDASIDNTYEILEHLKELDSRIKVFHNFYNKGCYYSRNIGLLNASGEYVTFLDADDISHPERIEKQVSFLEENPSVKATMCLYKRFGTNWEILEDIEKECAASILFHRKTLLSVLGYFDDVKFGADSEFIARIQAYYSRSSVHVFPETMYYARFDRRGLTAEGDGKIFSEENLKITYTKSSLRQEYVKKYQKWHQSLPLQTFKFPLVEFPQIQRKFPVARKMAEYHPNHITGSLASFPPRKDALQKVITSILPQLHTLNIYLNEYDEIPEFLINKKINVFLGNQHHGDLKDNGKFYCSNMLKTGYHFTFDDDIEYPKDYVQKMILAIEYFNRQCVIGVHGSNYKVDASSYIKNREVYHFVDKADYTFVDILGTGTVAYHTDSLQIELSDLKTKGCVDLWFATKVKQAGLGMVTIQRDSGWLKRIELKTSNLFEHANSHDKELLKLFNEYLRPLLKKRNYIDYHNFINNRANRYFSAYNMAKKSTGYIWPSELEMISTEKIEIALIVTGWNCVQYVNMCLGSILNQVPGNYTYTLYIYNDASDDGTREILDSIKAFDNINVVHGETQMGPAFARDYLIRMVTNPQAICVCLDLDDALKPNALKIVANTYLTNNDCWATSGNWIDTNGKKNPLTFYENCEIDSNKYRKSSKFHYAPLRTFKRFLYDAISDKDLKDNDGNWLFYCTDVAMMLPILDQCQGKNVVFINEVLYIYTVNRDDGTIKKYGKPNKERIFNQLIARGSKSLVKEMA